MELTYGPFAFGIIFILVSGIMVVGCSKQGRPIYGTVVDGDGKSPTPVHVADVSATVDIPDGAVACPLSLDFEGMRPPTMEVMPVLASDGKVYVNWEDACTNPAVKWFYPFNHPKSLAAKERE